MGRCTKVFSQLFAVTSFVGSCVPVDAATEATLTLHAHVPPVASFLCGDTVDLGNMSGASISFEGESNTGKVLLCMDGPSVHQSFAAKHQETGESTPIVVYLTTSRQEEEIQPGKSILVQLQDFQVSGAIRFACPNKDALAGGKYRGEFHVTVSPAR